MRVCAAAALLAAAVVLAPGGATMARRQAAPNLAGLKARTMPGFALKKRTTTPKGVVELWERTADAAQLRIEVTPGATPAVAEARLKAVNAKVGTKGNEPEELLYVFERRGPDIGWANYRGTHHITFKTYRYWKLQKGTLVTSDLSFTRGKPTFDQARGAFIAAKKGADGTLKALGLM